MFKSVSALLGLTLCAMAVDTRYWSSDSQSDFEKGSLKKVALRSDGRISLAPGLKEIADPSLPYLWTAVSAANGNVYAAGGPSSDKSPIFELTRAGQSRKIAEVAGMNVFALAVDRNNRIYAGSSPDGKIYRIAANGSVETFYDPKAKYIWALAFLPDGDLLAATGDKGELHRISPNGTGKVWMKLDEDHVRSLAIDAKGTVYVGTEPGGLIIRADAQGNPFVVYQSTKREVTTIATAKDGSIYAAVIGQKTIGSSMMIQNIQPVVVVPPAGAQGPQPRPPAASVPPPAATMIPGGSEIIRIDADGAPSRYWNHASDLVYALALDSNDRLLAGTGNKGNLYRIDNAVQSTMLMNLSSTQVTAFAKDGNRLVVVTGNIGKFFEVGGAIETQGSFESEVFDGGGFTQWGRLHAKEALAGGAIRYETRSGNLDRPTQMWSPWAPLNAGRITSPPARFLQWRAVFSGGQQDGPSLSQVDVAYLPKNVAPRIDIVEPTPANYRFPAPSTTIIPIAQTLTLPAIGKSAANTVATNSNDGANSPALTYTRGMIGARWLASDENGDALEFTLEIKGENEQNWKPLKDKLKDRYYSYDATAFTDGRYVVRVTASDSPANPLNQGLSAQAVSAPFLIDNSAPVISGLSAVPAASKVNLRFKAVDSASVITKAEISINGGDWKLVDPTVRLADSKDLDFQLAIDRPAPGELTIAVRVSDEFDNQTVDKVTIR